MKAQKTKNVNPVLSTDENIQYSSLSTLYYLKMLEKQLGFPSLKVRGHKEVVLEFSWTEYCILGALSLPNDFFMNPLVQGHSGIAPEASRNAYGTNQERMRTTPGVILRRASCRARRHETLAQKMTFYSMQFQPMLFRPNTFLVCLKKLSLER